MPWPNNPVKRERSKSVLGEQNLLSPPSQEGLPLESNYKQAPEVFVDSYPLYSRALPYDSGRAQQKQKKINRQFIAVHKHCL